MSGCASALSAIAGFLDEANAPEDLKREMQSRALPNEIDGGGTLQASVCFGKANSKQGSEGNPYARPSSRGHRATTDESAHASLVSENNAQKDDALFRTRVILASSRILVGGGASEESWPPHVRW